MLSSPSSIFLFFFIFSYSIMTQKNSQAPDPVSCKFKHDESTIPVSGCQFQICCYETFILSDAQKSSKVWLLLLLMLCSCLENFGFNPDFVEAVPIFWAFSHKLFHFPLLLSAPTAFSSQAEENPKKDWKLKMIDAFSGSGKQNRKVTSSQFLLVAWSNSFMLQTRRLKHNDVYPKMCILL